MLAAAVLGTGTQLSAGLDLSPGLDPVLVAKAPPPDIKSKAQTWCYNGNSKHCVNIEPAMEAPGLNMEYLIPERPSGMTAQQIEAELKSYTSDSDVPARYRVRLLMGAHQFNPALATANKALKTWYSSFYLLAERAQIYAHFGDYTRAQADLDAALFWTLHPDRYGLKYVRPSQSFFDWLVHLRMMRAINLTHLGRIAEAQAELAAIDTPDRGLLALRDSTSGWVLTHGNRSSASDLAALDRDMQRSDLSCSGTPGPYAKARSLGYKTDQLFILEVRHDARCGRTAQALAKLEPKVLDGLKGSDRDIAYRFRTDHGVDFYWPDYVMLKRAAGDPLAPARLLEPLVRKYSPAHPPAEAYTHSSDYVYLRQLMEELSWAYLQGGNFQAAADMLFAIRPYYGDLPSEDNWSRAYGPDLKAIALAANAAGTKIGGESGQFVAAWQSGTWVSPEVQAWRDSEARDKAKRDQSLAAAQVADRKLDADIAANREDFARIDAVIAQCRDPGYFEGTLGANSFGEAVRRRMANKQMCSDARFEGKMLGQKLKNPRIEGYYAGIRFPFEEN